MIILCDRCGRGIDIDVNVYYTTTQSRTGKQNIICEQCNTDIFRFKRVESVLREVNEKHFNSKKKKDG